MNFLMQRDYFLFSFVSALVIILGSSLYNGSNEENMSKAYEVLGGIIYVLGWLAFAGVIAQRKSMMAGLDKTMQKIIQGCIIAFAILVVVFAFLEQMTSKKQEKHHERMIYGLIYSLALIAFGVCTGNNMMTRIVGGIGALLIIIGMLVFIPMQRKQCMADGPGMALYTLGFMCMIFASSLIIPKTTIV